MIDFFFKNKEWLFSGLGVLFISFLLTGLGYIIRILYLRFLVYSSHIRNYVGCYEIYHYRAADNGEIRKGGVRISWSWLGRLEVFVTSHRYIFKGIVYVVYHNLFIELETKPRGIKLLWVFSEPLNEFDFLLGTYASVSLNGIPLSGKILLIKVPTNDISKLKSEDINSDKVNPAIKALLDIQSSRCVKVELPSSPFINEVQLP